MSDQQRGFLLLGVGILVLAVLQWTLSKDHQQAMRTAKYIIVHHCKRSLVTGYNNHPTTLYKCTTGTFTKAELTREANTE